MVSLQVVSCCFREEIGLFYWCFTFRPNFSFIYLCFTGNLQVIHANFTVYRYFTGNFGTPTVKEYPAGFAAGKNRPLRVRPYG